MSAFAIDVFDEAKAGKVVVAQLRAAARAVLLHEGIGPPAGLTLLLTDDEALQRLNRDFLDVDAPTDVLSFPAGEPEPADAGNYLGDIAISVPRAAAQAFAAGHKHLAELQLLAVHGVLHLIGYDHADAGQKADMWRVQAAILETLGAEITAPAVED